MTAQRLTMAGCKIAQGWGAVRGCIIPAHAWDPRLPAVRSWRERVAGR